MVENCSLHTEYLQTRAPEQKPRTEQNRRSAQVRCPPGHTEGGINCSGAVGVRESCLKHVSLNCAAWLM